MRLRASISAIAAVLSVTMIADVASAACTRLSFSVNDYGKDGPTKDAKALLDTYIAKWTAERGIKKYTTGKKDVSCELYLNLIVVDEHTCKAEASVCWDGAKVPVTASAPQAGGNLKPTGSGALPAKAKSSSAASATSAVTTGAIPPSAASAAVASTPADTAPVSIPAADAPKKTE